MKAIIFGIKGTSLTEEEKEFFKKVNPVGFILFSRNLETSSQIKQLIQNLYLCTDRENIPILIDQEGGRVQRLGPKLGYNRYPAAQLFSNLEMKDLERAKELCKINFRILGSDLINLGINVNCAPCLDILDPSAHNVIGDRSFGNEPKIISILGKAAIDGLREAGVMPIIKHIPGHGRALVDSHLELPEVTLSMEELENTDFLPFKELALYSELAMTAHIVYKAIDPDFPITLSPKGIRFIREHIGFKGILISDDLSMKALEGSLDELAEKSYKAGCDLVLHCNGNLEEMKQVSKVDLPVNKLVQEILTDKSSKLAQVKADKINKIDKETLLSLLKEQTGFEYGLS